MTTLIRKIATYNTSGLNLNFLSTSNFRLNVNQKVFDVNGMLLCQRPTGFHFETTGRIKTLVVPYLKFELLSGAPINKGEYENGKN